MTDSKTKLLGLIEKKSSLVLKTQKNSNLLIDLLKYASSNKKASVQIKAITELTKLFEVLLQKKRLVLLNSAQIKQADDDKNNSLNAEEKYRVWLFKRYADFKELLVACIENEEKCHSDSIKVTCINCIFSVIKYETQSCEEVTTVISKNDENEETAQKFNIPFELFNSMLDALFRKELLNEKILKKFNSYMSYTDLRYFCLKYLLTEFYLKEKIDETGIENLLNVFSSMPFLVKEKKATFIKPPTIEEKDPEIKKLEEEMAEAELDDIDLNRKEDTESIEKKYERLFVLKKENLSLKSKICQQDIHRKMFNDAFVNLLKNKLNVKLYKKLLIKLPEKLLPKMSNPLMLADFLTQSYNSGGLISVLSLNSLFVLINSYNLEYPLFYEKVYELLDASLFSTKYKDRFFQLLDTFLLSSHLSAQLIGSFIKKLSRLSLTCPPGDLRFLILFVFNLLIRHQNCKVLIHRNSSNKMSSESITKSDPFDVNAKDFTKTNALKSSIWEIMSLKTHYLSHVSKEVDKIHNLNQPNEFMLDEAFENNSYEDLIMQELDTTKGTCNYSLNFKFEESVNSFDYDSDLTNLLKFN